MHQSRFGPHCVQECSVYGHSDSCWLNNVTILTARQNRTPQKGVQVNSITQFDINQFNRTRPEYDSRLELDLTPVEQNRSPHFGLHSDQDHQIISSRKGEKLPWIFFSWILLIKVIIFIPLKNGAEHFARTRKFFVFERSVRSFAKPVSNWTDEK